MTVEENLFLIVFGIFLVGWVCGLATELPLVPIKRRRKRIEMDSMADILSLPPNIQADLLAVLQAKEDKDAAIVAANLKIATLVQQLRADEDAYFFGGSPPPNPDAAKIQQAVDALNANTQKLKDAVESNQPVSPLT
jgi:hypothetical protein